MIKRRRKIPWWTAILDRHIRLPVHQALVAGNVSGDPLGTDEEKSQGDDTVPHLLLHHHHLLPRLAAITGSVVPEMNPPAVGGAPVPTLRLRASHPRLEADIIIVVIMDAKKRNVTHSTRIDIHEKKSVQRRRKGDARKKRR